MLAAWLETGSAGQRAHARYRLGLEPAPRPPTLDGAPAGVAPAVRTISLALARKVRARGYANCFYATPPAACGCVKCHHLGRAVHLVDDCLPCLGLDHEQDRTDRDGTG